MGSAMDNVKGKVKEAAGVVADDKGLEREGKRDQAGATIKEKLEDAKDKADELVDKAKDKLNEKR